MNQTLLCFNQAVINSVTVLLTSHLCQMFAEICSCRRTSWFRQFQNLFSYCNKLVFYELFLCLENRNDGTEFGGSIYQKVNEKIETSINLAWTAGSNNTRFGIAAKYKLDCRTSLSVRTCYQMDLLLGFHLSCML